MLVAAQPWDKCECVKDLAWPSGFHLGLSGTAAGAIDARQDKALVIDTVM